LKPRKRWTACGDLSWKKFRAFDAWSGSLSRGPVLVLSDGKIGTWPPSTGDQVLTERSLPIPSRQAISESSPAENLSKEDEALHASPVEEIPSDVFERVSGSATVCHSDFSGQLVTGTTLQFMNLMSFTQLQRMTLIDFTQRFELWLELPSTENGLY
jgi:hypothetical protein